VDRVDYFHPAAGDTSGSTVSGEERGEDMHRGGLPDAVGAEQRNDCSLGDVHVYAVEDGVVTVRLAEPGHVDRRWPDDCHDCLHSWVSRCVSITVEESADRSLVAR
jgi:hypothetical protein